MSQGTSLFKTIFKVSSLSAVATILYFLSDLYIASKLGISEASDAFFIASTIPAIIIGICLSIGSSLVPLFVPDVKRSAIQLNEFYSTIFNLLFLALLALVVINIILAPYLVLVISPGINSITLELAASFSQIIAPTALFTGLSGLMAGMLNAHRRFTYAALSTLVRSSATLLGMFIFSSYGAVGMSYGWLFGGFIQFIVVFMLCRACHVFRYRPLIKILPDLSAAFVLARTALFGMGTNQLIQIIEKVIGSFLPPGTISAFSYATRIVRGGAQILVFTVGQVSLPELSSQNAQNRLEDAYNLLMRNLRFLVYFTFPIATICISMSSIILTILFQHGAMSTTQIARIAPLFSVASIGLIFSGFYELTLVFLYAQRRTREINIFYAIFLVSFILAGVFIGLRWVGIGLALLYPISLLISSLYGMWVLKLEKHHWKPLINYVLKLILTGLLIGTGIFVLIQIIPVAGRNTFNEIQSFSVLIAGTVFAVILWLSITSFLHVSETKGYLKLALSWVKSLH